MPFALVDEFRQTLGECHDDLASAELAVQQLGENAGEVILVETTQSLPDMTNLSEQEQLLTGRRWSYDSINEKFIQDN
jgi:hypothetical protein